MGDQEYAKLLSWLAAARNVTVATQNRALSAILFLYKHVLNIGVEWPGGVVRVKLCVSRWSVTIKVAEVADCRVAAFLAMTGKRRLDCCVAVLLAMSGGRRSDCRVDVCLRNDRIKGNAVIAIAKGCMDALVLTCWHYS